MNSEAYNSLLHQLIVMSRDPMVYLAIDVDSGIFNHDEILAIRIAKVYAYLGAIRVQEALQAANALLADLKAAKYRNCRIMVYLAMAGAQIRMGNHALAKAEIEDAVKLLNKDSSGDLRGVTGVFQIMIAQYNLENVDASIEGMQIALQKVEHPFFRVVVLRSMSKVYLQKRQDEIALNYLSAAYEAATQNQLSISILEISNDMIMVCGRLGKFEMGERFFDIAKKLFAQLRLSYFKASVNFNYGTLKIQEKDYPAAVHFFKESLLDIKNKRLKLPVIKFKCFNQLAFALNEMGESHPALEYQLKAEKQIAKSGTQEMRADLSANIAVTLISLGKWDEALQRLKEVLAFYRKYEKKDKEIGATRSLAHYYQKRKDYPQSIATLKKLDELNIDYIRELRESHSRVGENTLKEIIEDSKALRDKYDKLLLEVTKRQTARFTGVSVASKRVIDSSVLAAMHLDANVLIQGASGTGKEIVAQMIHYNSKLKNFPFIKVNCASIPAAQFEADFFGYLPAKFADEAAEIKGYFEQAAQGTLFLDEVTEIPPEFQQKLLSALDTKSFIPVGNTLPRPIRCRIISSTGQDLIELFKESRFRIDLLHRLNTLEIKVPTLKERAEDIPMLVDVFVREYARETTKRVPTIKEGFYERLRGYDYPGNVRELKNIIERIFILYYEEQWTADILDNIYAFSRAGQLKGNLLQHDIQDLDKERIIEALKKTNGKQKTAAKLLSMTESTLCRKIKRYGIKYKSGL